MLKKLNQALSVVSALLLAACAESIPSDEQARKVATNSFQHLIVKGGRVIDVRKQNGESLEREGEKYYAHTFLAAVELPAGILAYPTDYFASDSRKTGDHGFMTDPGPRGYIAPYPPKTSLPAGTTVVRRGVIVFKKSEAGWSSYNDLPETVATSYCTQLKPDACYKNLGWDKPFKPN